MNTLEELAYSRCVDSRLIADHKTFCMSGTIVNEDLDFTLWSPDIQKKACIEGGDIMLDKCNI
jgi:hypothetical protein